MLLEPEAISVAKFQYLPPLLDVVAASEPCVVVHRAKASNCTFLVLRWASGR
jgi:hypothetical protein